MKGRTLSAAPIVNSTLPPTEDSGMEHSSPEDLSNLSVCECVLQHNNSNFRIVTTTAQSSARAPMVMSPQPASKESAGNSLEGVSPSVNVVTDLSFASIARASNCSELSDECDRSEPCEGISVEDDDSMQSSTAYSGSEGSNINDHDE